jgi:hypothetical protein
MSKVRKLFSLVLGLGLGLLLATLPSAPVGATSIRSQNLPQVTGLALMDADDPTGNGEPTVEVVWIQSDGTIVHAGVYFYQHNSAGVQAYFANTNQAPSGTFSYTSSSQTVTLTGGKIVVGGS